MNLKQIFRYRWQECSFVSAMKAWLVSYLFDDWMLTPVDTFFVSSLLPILLTEAFREVSAYPWLQIHPIERKSKAQILFQDHEFCWQLWQQDEEVLQRKHSTHFDVGQQVCETAEKYNLRSKGPFINRDSQSVNHRPMGVINRTVKVKSSRFSWNDRYSH